MATVNPNLAKEWCYELNGEITPDKVQAGGKKEVWWECPICSNRWKAQLYQRNKGHYKCKKCKSLAWNYPELLSDWDYEKNIDIDPFEIDANSHKKVCWKCQKCGYRWSSSVYERKVGHKACIGCNSIAKTHTEKAKDWDYEQNGNLTPCDVTFGSNKFAWWRCSRNPKHITYQRIADYCNSGCSICSAGRNTSVNEIAFYLAFKEVFIDTRNRYRIDNKKQLEADIFIPSIFLALEYDSNYYHKSKAKQKIDETKNKKFFERKIHTIRIRERDLPTIKPYESEVVILDNRISSLNECFNEIINVVYKLFESDSSIFPYINSLKKVDIDSMRVNALTYLTSVPKSDSLAYNNPSLISEWHPTKNGTLTPFDVYQNANYKAWWICKSDPTHEWYAMICKRNSGEKCPYCYGRGSAMIVTEENSLASKFPDIAKQWHPTLNGDITPNQVYMYSTKSYWWQCDKDKRHVWKTPVAKRTRLNRGCHYCTKQKVLQEESFAALNPVLLKLWDFSLNVNMDPYTIGVNSKRKVSWICNEGHSYIDTVINQVKGTAKCNICNTAK